MSSSFDISNEDLQQEILKKYGKYKKSNKTPSFNSLCFPDQFTYQIQQLFVSKYINPDTDNKSLLLFHKIGAGKTCASILIALQWYKKRKVIFIVPASLVSNLYKEFRSECTGSNYVTKKERELLNKLNPLSKEYKILEKEINDRIDKDFDIYSFHKFISKYENGEISLKNCLLIVDEVQNIVSENGFFYKKIFEATQNASSNTRIVVMSGTPIFDKPVELALTVNLLKPKKLLPVGKEFNNMFVKYSKKGIKLQNKEILSDLLKGYISFYPGAPKIAFPKEIFKMVKCEMSEFQYNSYKMVYKREGNYEFKDILKLSNAFFIGSRMISNVSFPNKKVGEKGLESLTGKKLHFNYIGKYAVKFVKIMSKIKNIKGPSIVYSNFREYGGIEPFIKMLEYNGYINLFDENARKKKYNKKRFAIWSGKESDEIKEMAKNVYNKKDNADGDLLKIMILSPSGKEGLSLLRTRSIHIMEPYFNWSRIAQIIGRGSRFCSHKDLPKEERFVKIYMYISVAKKMTVDEYINKIMIEKNKLLKEFYDLLENVAIDKHLFN